MRDHAETRQFVGLHAVLSEQVATMATSLARLGDCNDDAARAQRTVKGSASPNERHVFRGDECELIRALCAQHKGLLGQLRQATTVSAAHFEDQTTATLLADLIANHEADAFALRALRWKIENNYRNDIEAGREGNTTTYEVCVG